MKRQVPFSYFALPDTINIIVDRNVSYHVSKIAEQIEQFTGVKERDQSFYFKGKRVYNIQKKDLGESEFYGIIDASDEPRIFVVFEFEIDSNPFRATVSVNHTKNPTVFHALWILSQNKDYSKLFSIEFEMKQADLDVNFDTVLSATLAPMHINIHTKHPENLIEIKIGKNDLTFMFTKAISIIKIKQYLTLYYRREIVALMTYAEEDLKDEKSLYEFENIENSTLTVTVKDVGGDPFSKLAVANHLRSTPGVPRTRYIKKGLSLLCICKKCNEYVYINKGYGCFDLVRHLSKLGCSRCSTLVTTISCGFYKCKWIIVGKSVEGESIDKRGEISEKAYSLFDDSTEINWIFLNIQAKPIA